MLEGIIAPTLERLLGQYIVDLPREQLRVGLWSGVLRLESVRVKPDAFDGLKLPFAVREGTIDLLELKIAWKTLLLRSHPICVTLEGVSLTASPRAEDEWAAEPAEMRALALKRAALAAAAELAATKRRGGADIADAASSPFLAAAVPTVLDRLRMKVGAVHVKFADMPKLADDECVAAFGLRLDSILVATSKTEREPEPKAPVEASASGRTANGVANAEFADADKTNAEDPSSPARPSTLNPRRRRRRIISGVRGVLAALTPMSQSKKRVDITGLRVYSRAKGIFDDGSPLEWYPAPRAPGAPDRLSAPIHPTWRARCDDRIDSDDVMLGAEMLIASLTVTARERSRPVTTSGAVSQSAQAPGFDVCVEVLSALEMRVRPSQMRSAMRLSDAMTVWELRDKYGSLRPCEAGPGGKREWRAWWQYAARAVMRETRPSPSLTNVISIAVPLMSRDESRVAMVARYAELYERKLRDEVTASVEYVGSSPAQPLSSTFDESFGEDQFFECDEDPSQLEGDALELYSLETQLALEELLAARAQAERAAYADEEEDEEEDFLDAEAFDEDDNTSKSSAGYFSRVTGALYKRGAGIATSAVGLATSAAARVADGATRYAISSGGTSVIASEEGSANGRTPARATGIVVELRSFTVVFRRETSDAPATDALALQFGGIRAELDSPEGLALRVEVRDLHGWLPSDGIGASSRQAMVWPRRDSSEAPDARSPVLRVTQLNPKPFGDTQPPVEMHIAPLNIVAHPSLAAALAPFGEEVPHTHQARLLDATRRLPGSAPRERLARAVASIQAQLLAQPWKLCMSQPLFLLPSASAPDAVYAAALEVASLAAECSPGGGSAPTAAATEHMRRRAERLTWREGALQDDVKEALESLERASTTHQTAVTFGGVRLLLPTPGSDRGETVWSEVINGWGGSGLMVSLSTEVGGPDAVTRASACFAPLRATVNPESAVALQMAGRAAMVFAASAAIFDDSASPVAEDPTGTSAGNAAMDLKVSFAEMSVALDTRHDAQKKRSSRRVSTSPDSATLHAVIRGVEAGVRAERNGDTRADVVIHEVGAYRGDEAFLRVVTPSSNEKFEDDGHHFARAEMSSTAASGNQQALLRACGLSISLSDALVGDVGAFAFACMGSKVAAHSDSTLTGLPNRNQGVKAVGRIGGIDDAATAALTLFGARSSKRSTLRVFPGGAPDGADGTVSEATFAREAAWTSLMLGESEQFIRARSTAFARLASENPNASAFAFAARSASSVVFVCSEASAASRIVSTVDVSGVAAALRRFQGESTSENHMDVDLTLETVRAYGATSTSAKSAILDFGVHAKALRVTDNADALLRPQSIDVRVSRARVGAHADFIANFLRWNHLASAKWAKSTASSALKCTLASPSASPAELKLAHDTASFGSTRLALVVEETSVFIPGLATGISESCGESYVGFLLAVGNASFATPFGLDDAAFVKEAPTIEASATSARVHALTRKDEEWASALRALPADASTTCPVVLEVVSVRVRERKPVDLTSFFVDIPLVRLVATPGVVASGAEAAARFAALAPAPAADAERDDKRDDADTTIGSILGSVDVRVGRASLLVHSSESRRGGYGEKGDEVAALVTASTLRLAADGGDANGGGKKKRLASVEVSFESIHALDVSGTIAGEAERMAAGNELDDRATEAGVPLAWIGSTGGVKQSVVAARAEGNMFFGIVPENAEVDVRLAGGGFVADVTAWDRAAMLACCILAKPAVGATAVLPPVAVLDKTKAPGRKKSVTFADQREARATESSDASFAFASGDWTVTLPWNPPDAGARALLLSLSAHASASAVIDIHLKPGSAAPAFGPKSWRADVRADSVTLALREAAKRKDVSGSNAYALSSSPVLEIRGFGCEVHSDGSEWHEGIACDVAAGDITLLVSRQRLTRIQEAGRVLEEFGGESSVAAAKGPSSTAAAKPSAAAKPATKTPFFASAPAVSATFSLGVMGLLVLEDDRTGLFTNIGPSLLEGAVLGASASVTFDPKERRTSLVAEARTLLDALDREKGAWEPVVEPWRSRLSADASFRSDGAPSKIEAVFAGVDGLEITVGEAGAAAAAAAARSLAAGSESAAPPSFSRTYWLHNATDVTAEYELDGVKEEGAHETGIRGVVAPRARVSIQFPRTETRAAPRYARVGGVEPWTTPAPAPKPARRRAVVVRFRDRLLESGPGSSPTPPIELDAFGVFELFKANTGHARVVAEVRRLADDDGDDRDVNDASLRVSVAASTRTELLLRSDLAFYNATLSPVELDLNVVGVDEHRMRVDPVRVEPGSRLWLPGSLANERARARWRPAKLAGADGDGTLFAWSEPVSIRAIAERRVVADSHLPSLPSLGGGVSACSPVSLASSSDPSADDALPPVTPIPSAATTTDADGTATPFACVISGRSEPRQLAAVVTLAPQLYVTNALAVPVIVSISVVSSAAEVSRIIASGDTVALHDAALDPRSPITVRARPRGFTHCESVAVPPVASAAMPSVFEAFRDVFAVRDEDDAFPNAPAFSTAPVSVRVRVAVDDRGARRVAVSAPAHASNATETPLAILVEPDAPPDPESLALGLALDARRERGFLSAREDSARPVMSPGEGDCLVPPASVANKSDDGVKALLRADSGVRSPVPARTRSREISHVDYSPEGRTRANLLLADGARPTASSPATSVFRQSSNRAVSPLKPPVDVSVAGPTSPPRPAPLRRTESTASARLLDARVPGVAMFGRSDAWHRASAGASDPNSALVRVRTADSSWWSPSTHLAVGDAPRVLKLPFASGGVASKKRWTRCDEYVASLVRSDVVEDAAGPLMTVTVRPRFTIYSRVPDHALFFRQPGSEATKTVPPAGEAVASRWSDEKNASSPSSRDVAFRPALPGIWAWSAPVAVDRIGVTHVTASVLPGYEGRAAARGAASFRAYRVAVSASRDTPGGFSVEVSELGPRDAVAFAPSRGRPRETPATPEPTKVVSPRSRISDPEDDPCVSPGPGIETSPTALRFPPRFRPLAQAIVLAADRASAAVKKTTATQRLTVRVEASAPSAGVSVVVDEDAHGFPRELVYARITSLHAQASAKGDSLETLREAEGSFALGAARVDLQTPETTARPTVFAAGAPSLSALSARVSAAFSETNPSGQHGNVSDGVVSCASRANGGSWCARSFSVDAAPMTIDLREAFGSSALRAAARLAAPFAARAAASPAPPIPSSPTPSTPSAPPIGFQSVRLGRVDAVVSFAALPFLPAGVRSIGAVDRARVTLRAFSLPSDAARRGSVAASASLRDGADASSPFFPPDAVARLAARHYLAESASQIVRLVASNKLLGDPARLWAELEAATRELVESPIRVRSATRFSRRVAAAVAAWAKTILRHAQQVTSEIEERFEAAKQQRLERLRSRRIADDGAEDDDADGFVSKEHPREADADRRKSAADPGVVAGVVAGVLRAAGHLVEGPLQGAELRGVTGLVEGAAEGVFGAAAATANAALALATDLADKLETYGFGEEDEDGEDADENEKETTYYDRSGAPGARRRRRPPPRLRAPRAPPASRLEPWRPYSCE